MGGAVCDSRVHKAWSRVGAPQIDRIAWPYESCHISDGVGDHELATQAARDSMQCLIKITRTSRVNGDQFQIRPVKIRKARLGGGFLGCDLDFGRKFGGHLDGARMAAKPCASSLGTTGGSPSFRAGMTAA